MTDLPDFGNLTNKNHVLIPVGTRVKHRGEGPGVVVKHYDDHGVTWNRVQFDNGHADGYKSWALEPADTPPTFEDALNWLCDCGMVEEAKEMRRDLMPFSPVNVELTRDEIDAIINYLPYLGNANLKAKLKALLDD